jgi:ribose/xylose/arabinose/galactoside ABC-type transport system permease subunit
MDTADLRSLPRWIPRHEGSLLIAVVVVLALTTWLDANHNYLSQPGPSAVNLTRTTSRLGFIALGAAVVIIAGGIDLSTGSVMAFSGTICAAILLWAEPEAMLKNQPLSVTAMALGIGGALVCGFLVGSLHAWLITSLGLPPFVATLGTLVGLRSLARAICDTVTAAYLGDGSSLISVPDLRFRYLATSVWIPVVLLAAISCGLWVMLGKTVTGRHLYALGGNEQAARLSGIDTVKMKWVAYVLSAMLSSLAGVLAVCEVSTAQPEMMARGYELNAIAAAVVGGCSLQGGIGTVPGTLLGALFLRVVIDGVANVIKTGADIYEGLIVGVLVVCAVALTKSSELAGGSRRLLKGALGWVTILNLTLILAALMALIGVRLIGDKVRLAPWQLTAWAAASGLAFLLMLQRGLPRDRAHVWLGVWGVLAVGSLIGWDFGNSRWQRASAIRMVKDLGGQVSRNETGIIFSLAGTGLTDEEWRRIVPKLSFFPELAELRLQNTQITNLSLEALGRLRRKPEHLQRIDLTGTQATPAGARRYLRDFQQLKTVP